MLIPTLSPLWTQIAIPMIFYKYIWKILSYVARNLEFVISSVPQNPQVWILSFFQRWISRAPIFLDRYKVKVLDLDTKPADFSDPPIHPSLKPREGWLIRRNGVCGAGSVKETADKTKSFRQRLKKGFSRNQSEKKEVSLSCKSWKIQQGYQRDRMKTGKNTIYPSLTPHLLLELYAMQWICVKIMSLFSHFY